MSYKHYYFKENRKCRDISIPDIHVQKLEAFQNRVLKRLFPSPKQTSPAVLRLISGTMPISARIDILKLRYFWKISHSNEDNYAHIILNYKRRFFLESNVGFVHEIFNICCKYDCLDVWHLKREPKENKFATIRRIVEAYHVQKDLAKSTGCLYMSILFQMTPKRCRAYKLDPFFCKMGLFSDTKRRSYFILLYWTIVNG